MVSLVLTSAATGALNILPAAPVASGLLVLAVIAKGRLSPHPMANAVNRVMLLYAVAWLGYAAICGVSLSDPELYRREAKFVLPFATFWLCTQLQRPSHRTSRAVLKLALGLAFASMVFLLVSWPLRDLHLALYPYGGSMWGAYDAGSKLYSGQFISHSAAGGFFATLFLLLFGVWQRRGAGRLQQIVLLALIAVGSIILLTRSRAFLVAVVVVCVAALLGAIRPRIVGRMLLGVALMGTAMVSHGLLVQRFEDAPHEFVDSTSTEVSEYNVAARLVLWRKALEDFLRSPLVGIGASRFDDEFLVLATFPPEDRPEVFDRAPMEPEHWTAPGLAVNVDAFAAHTDQHAHNLYLHTLAETGLAGLALLMTIVWRIERALAWTMRNAHDKLHASLAQGARYGLAGILVGSLFGNNFLTVIPMHFYFAICAAIIGCGPRSARASGRWIES